MTYDNASANQLPSPSEVSQPLREFLREFGQRPGANEAGGKRRGRPAQVSDHLLSLGVLWCVLHGWVSQWDLWRRLAFFGVAGFEAVRVCDQAIYNRLGRQGGALMQQCAQQVSQWLWERMAPFEEVTLAPFACQVLALDESVLGGRKRWLPELRGTPPKDARLLGGRLSCLFDLRRQQWGRIDWLPDGLANCQVHAQAMLQSVQRGALLLFDLGYYNFAWFDGLTQRGIWWVARLRSNGSLKLQHILCQRDGYLEALVFVGDRSPDHCRYLVRLLRVRYRGLWYSYLSNVTDPLQLSGAELVQLYARRWDIELGFRLLKEHLGLRWLWSAKPEVMAAQLWATVALAQLLHALQVQVARQAGVETFDVSMELLTRYLPELAAAAQRSGQGLLEVLARHGATIGLLRPNRRTHWQVPIIGWQELIPVPVDLVWERPARYGHRPAGSRPKGRAYRRRRPFV